MLVEDYSYSMMSKIYENLNAVTLSRGKKD